MKLDAGDIRDLVAETERKRRDWAAAAEVWETMWSLKQEDTRRTVRELDSMEQVILPDPYNIVQLVSRFVANEMRVEIPYLTAKEEDDERSTKIEEWLSSLWIRSGKQQGRNVIEDMTWSSSVRGRGAMQVLWIGEELKKHKLFDRRLPILPRWLDPLNTGICRGPYWTDHAYHKYKTTRTDIIQRYPDYQLPDLEEWNARWKEKHTVIDMWWRDKGAIWHAVTVDDKFAIDPTKTNYPEVPIFEWYADGAPIDDELARSLSILHPIKDLWEYKCELASKIGTGLLYYFDPVVKAIGITEDIKIGPGETIYLTEGKNLDFVRPEPNVPMAEKMMQLIQTSMDQATFPAVLYGEQPGGVQAGFAINNLATQARNRVNTIRSNLETALETANELVLALVEEFGGKEGVPIWGGSERIDRARPITLSGKDIKGNWSNEVRLIPETPMDDSARTAQWLQMVKEGIISKSTMRNRGVNVPLPRDEEIRVKVEQTMESDELRPMSQLRAIQHWYKKSDWEVIVQVSPTLKQAYDTEQQWREQKAQEEEAAKEARRQERLQKMLQEGKAHMMPDGTIMEGAPTPEMMGVMAGGSSPMNPSMGLDAMAMGGPPTPPSGAPPSGPGRMMGMPPDMGMQGAPPLTAPPQGPPGIGLPPGPPPGPPSLQPPGMEGMPPQMMGQIAPDELGIPPGATPGTFQEMMGEPLTDDEILRRMAGLGMPPPPM